MVVLRVVEDVVPALTLLALVAVISTDVLMRYLFNNPITGAGEICRLLFVWSVLLGASGACRRNLHVGFELLAERLRVRSAAAVGAVVSAISIAVLVCVVYLGVQITEDSAARTMELLDLPYALLTAAVPVGAALMTFRFGQVLVADLRTLFNRNPSLTPHPPGGRDGDAADRDTGRAEEEIRSEWVR